MIVVILELFIAGTAINSSKALANLKRILSSLDVQADLRITDVIAEPARAWESGVLVTPVLMRRRPEPSLMLLGSLDDPAQLAAFIGIAA